VEKPYLGASPDGFVNCKCCGMARESVEVKCLLCVKDGLLLGEELPGFCMEKKNGM